MCDNLDFDDIKDQLLSQEIISHRQKGRIEAEKGNANKISTVIDQVMKTDLTKTFEPFLNVLANSGTSAKYCFTAIEEKYNQIIGPTYGEQYHIMGAYHF